MSDFGPESGYESGAESGQVLPFATAALGERVVIARDSLSVHELLAFDSGSLAVFELAGGKTGRAIVHAEVDELWYFLSGRGRLWRSNDSNESIEEVGEGTCVSLPRGTRFQVQAYPKAKLKAVAVTLPRWPGDDAARVVEGPWVASVPRTECSNGN